MITRKGGILESIGRYLHLVTRAPAKNPEFEAQVKCLETLISDQRVLMIGPIRQEVLSGYSDPIKFETLKTKLSYFENTAILDEEWSSNADNL
jgi:hypothetical protein